MYGSFSTIYFCSSYTLLITDGDVSFPMSESSLKDPFAKESRSYPVNMYSQFTDSTLSSSGSRLDIPVMSKTVKAVKTAAITAYIHSDFRFLILKIFTDLAITTLVMKKVISVPTTIPMMRNAFELSLKLWKKNPNTVIPTKTTR